MLSIFSFHTTLDQSTFHQLSFLNTDGSVYEFGNLKGKVVLVVNTASGCGFAPQFNQLQTLYQKYHQAGLEILAFPSDNFGGQEPLNNNEILQHCSRNYGVSFPVFEKSNVIGKGANPVFTWLNSPANKKPLFSKPIWNFQKFLIDKQGKLVKIYLPFVSPSSSRFEKAIVELLGQ